MGPAEWLMLGLLSIVWGGAFFFYKLLDEAGLPPFTIVLGRVGLAGLVLAIVVLLTERRFPRDRRTWGAFVVLGLLNNIVPFSLIIVAEQRIDSGLASIFNATTPIFTALVAQWLSHDEKLSRGKVAGIVLGLLGVIVLMGPSALHGLDLTSLAQLSSVAAAVVYAFAAVYARGLIRGGVDPLVTSAGQLIASTVIVAPLVLLFDHPWTVHGLPTTAWWAWAGLALPSTALAYVFYFGIMAKAGATNAAAVTFLVPISAIALGSLFLGEHLAPSAVAGMALIFAGLAALDGRVFTVLGSRRAPLST